KPRPGRPDRGFSFLPAKPDVPGLVPQGDLHAVAGDLVDADLRPRDRVARAVDLAVDLRPGEAAQELDLLVRAQRELDRLHGRLLAHQDAGQVEADLRQLAARAALHGERADVRRHRGDRVALGTPLDLDAVPQRL